MAIMTSRQAAELDVAFERNEWTAKMVKELCRGDVLTVHRKILQGEYLALKSVGTVNISKQVSEFTAADHFVIDASDNVSMKIVLSKDFDKWFLSKKNKQSEDLGLCFEEDILCYHEIVKNLADISIISELGGEQAAETSLQELFAVMKKQGRCGNGALLVNEKANIFYIRDINGILRVVYCSCRKDTWIIYAFPIGCGAGSRSGCRVFCRRLLES